MSKRSTPDSATILKCSRGVFIAQWEELLRLRRAVLKTSNQDDIHDLRVTSRRLRASLELFYPLVAKSPRTTGLRKQIRKLTEILGGLRNIDEALLFFQSRIQADLRDANKLVSAFSRLRPRELGRVHKALKAFDQRNLDRIVRKMVAGLDDAPMAGLNSISLLAYFSGVSIRLYLPILQLFAGSTAPWERASRHALRIAIKKMRYFFELISSILGRDYASLLGQLKEYQLILGRLNDIAEFEALIRNLKLPKAERKFAKTALLTEETLLLEKFAGLIEQKPLIYAFLI